MKLKDYIRQMDDAELAEFLVRAEDELYKCVPCVYAREGGFCIAPDGDGVQHCIEVMQILLEKDVEDSLFDDFFCR